MLRYFILCITFLHSAYEIVDSYMYTFNVGQGNCQLAKYILEDETIENEDEQKTTIGILGDCGTSETTYDLRFGYKPGNPIKAIEGGKSSPMKKSTTDQSKQEVDYDKISPKRKNCNKHTFAENIEHEHFSNKQYENEMKKSYAIKDIRTNLFDNVAKELSDIDLLIIFLSHPDDDHINRVEHVVKQYQEQRKAKEKEHKIVSFLCGNWSKTTLIVQNTSAYLKTNSTMFMPYKWENQRGKSPNFFSGDFIKLLTEAQNYVIGDNDQKKYKEEILGKFDKQLDTLKDYVNILSMNTPQREEVIKGKTTINDNTCSSIISFLLKGKGNNYTEFICTGDADEHTISAMKNGKTYKNYKNHRKATLGNEAIIDVILTMPHHGSTYWRLEEVLNAFDPHVLVISAGSGYVHAHPNNELTNSLNNIMEFKYKQDDKNQLQIAINRLKERHQEFLTKNNQLIKFGLVDFELVNKLPKFNSMSFDHQYIWSTYYNGSIMFCDGDYYIDGPSTLSLATLQSESAKNKDLTDDQKGILKKITKCLKKTEDSENYYTINLIKHISKIKTKGISEEELAKDHIKVLDTLYISEDLSYGFKYIGKKWYLIELVNTENEDESSTSSEKSIESSDDTPQPAVTRGKSPSGIESILAKAKNNAVTTDDDSDDADTKSSSAEEDEEANEEEHTNSDEESEESFDSRGDPRGHRDPHEFRDKN